MRPEPDVEVGQLERAGKPTGFIIVVVVVSLLTNIDTRNGSTLKYRG